MNALDPHRLIMGCLAVLIAMLSSCGGEAEDETTSSTPKAGARASRFQKGATLIASVSGEVMILEKIRRENNSSSSQKDRRPAKAKEVVGPGTRVKTGQNSGAVLLFSNGSLATIGPNSELLIDAFDQQEFEGSDKKTNQVAEEISPSKIKLELNSGELIFDVKKLKKDSFLEVSTPLGIAGVRGTQFKIDASKDRVAVSVLSGSVDFASPRNDVSSIAKGKSLVAKNATRTEQIAIPAADGERIKAANQVARQRTDHFSLSNLNQAFDQVNLKVGSRPYEPNQLRQPPAATQEVGIPVQGAKDLALWLDSTDIDGKQGSPKLGSPVGKWMDKSGKGRHAVKPASKMHGAPSCIMDKKIGKPVLFFSQSQKDVLRIPYKPNYWDNLTIFVVARPEKKKWSASGSAIKPIIRCGEVTRGAGKFAVIGRRSEPAKLGFSGYGKENYSSLSTRFSDGKYHVVTLIISGGEKKKALSSYHNGVPKAKYSAVRSSNTSNVDIGGCAGDNSYHRYFNGYLAEVILYQKWTMPDDFRQATERYLAKKWQRP